MPGALLAEQKGYDVVGIDYDASKIKNLERRIMPYHEPRLQQKLENSNIYFTTDYGAIKDANSIIVCVPTPIHDDKTRDLSPIVDSAQGIGKHLQPEQLVVLESTVNPSVTERYMLPLLENKSNLRVTKDFYLAHCPEFIDPGNIDWPLEKIARVVGASDPIGLERAVDFYESLLDVGWHEAKGKRKEVKVTPVRNIRTAEMVKMFTNSKRLLDIAAVNEIVPYCEAHGIDVYEMLMAAETKPFGQSEYARPGLGIGGHCIPVDPHYMIQDALELGIDLQLYTQAAMINEQMPHYTFSQLSRGLNKVHKPVNGSTIAVLGLSYKEQVDDIRETPVIPFIHELEEEQAIIRVYDPFVPPNRIPHGFQKYAVATLDDAITGADALVVATAHHEFREKLTGDYLASKGVRVAIDGRNCLSAKECADAGVIFRGVGRQPYTSQRSSIDRLLLRAVHGNGGNGQHGEKKLAS